MPSTYILVAGDARIGNLVAAAAGTRITAVVVGTRAVADAVAASAVATVVWLGEPGENALEAFAGPVADVVAAAAPQLVLASTRPSDRVLAGAVAARLGAPVSTMVSEVVVSGDGAQVTRGVYGGIAQEVVAVTGTAVVILDGGASGTGGDAPVEEVAAVPAGVVVVENRPAARTQVDLGRAQRIVSVGRGLKSQDDVAMVEALAAALDAETACSRPLAEGVSWFTKDRYVGITGQHVSPDLYLALGISGQLQHAVGARGAGTIVAVNTDKDCPYFKEADYCIVGDLYDVVPALTRALT
ncbi:electron transfer flavoprotein alpha subunit apoprotein [Sanguibacter gelidistatuariae]|uniref:Electron transfer flavoprotein alpha subunit apoprotein n=1 Tax=Sanguibacter gelidistatuariae TaxID=1814289 RepID=A0A1G6N1F8_9MICO|nr:electron transfer flavoprotein subunit alpha/FixB family protein [Sanguibacter gelidistatuariae]SDC61056.1 electron transfer flavoprotein alpha subunit apoprotein [Sanguibacter gelidistatuariae]